MNAIDQLELEIAYYDVAAQNVNHYSTESPRQYQRSETLKLQMG